MKINLDPKQLEIIKAVLDKAVNVAEKIATEMKRANSTNHCFISEPVGVLSFG